MHHWNSSNYPHNTASIRSQVDMSREVLVDGGESKCMKPASENVRRLAPSPQICLYFIYVLQILTLQCNILVRVKVIGYK